MGVMMSNDLSLIQKLVAIELGHEWEWHKRYESGTGKLLVDEWQAANETMDLVAAIHKVSAGIHIRLTSKPWDWPVCEREGYLVWNGSYVKTFEPGLNLSNVVYPWSKMILPQVSANFGPFNVLPNPLDPDEVPPSDWSADGRRVIK